MIRWQRGEPRQQDHRMPNDNPRLWVLNARMLPTIDEIDAATSSYDDHAMHLLRVGDLGSVGLGRRS
jgi:hypothetical protein